MKIWIHPIRHRQIVLWTAFALLLAGCAGNPTSDSGTTAPVVLASTTFLADITRQVAGDRVTVESLLPIGTDPHSYQPTPQDVTKIAESKLLIINGADYEHFLEPLLENAGGEREVSEASAGLQPRENAGAEHGVDPHLWLDPNNVITYVENIREALTHFDPEGTADYQVNAETYTAELNALDAWILEQVNQIPAERRLLVTNHEAFGYFAERYGFTVVGTVIESFSSDASPSAQQLAALVDQVKSSGAPAIFLDEVENPALAQQIADETGVRVVTDLHLESLTDGAPSGTYIDMMKHNVTQIVNALKRLVIASCKAAKQSRHDYRDCFVGKSSRLATLAPAAHLPGLQSKPRAVPGSAGVAGESHVPKHTASSQPTYFGCFPFNRSL